MSTGVSLCEGECCYACTSPEVDDTAGIGGHGLPDPIHYFVPVGHCDLRVELQHHSEIAIDCRRASRVVARMTSVCMFHAENAKRGMPTRQLVLPKTQAGESGSQPS